MKTKNLKEFEKFKIAKADTITGGGQYPMRRETTINGGGYVYESADGSYYYEFHNGTSFSGSDWSPGAMLYN